MSEANQQALIDRMDPNANYGPRTYRKARREASVGLLMLSEGEGNQPVIKSVETGKLVPGTGQLLGASTGREPSARSWEQEFEDRGLVDFPRVYDALIEKATGSHDGKPDTKAIIYYMDRMMGRPKEMVSHGLDKKTEQLFAKMTQSEEVALTLAPGITVIEPDPK